MTFSPDVKNTKRTFKISIIMLQKRGRIFPKEIISAKRGRDAQKREEMCKLPL